MRQPKIQFANDKELNKYLEEWKHRLFLDNWIITASLKDKVTVGDAECFGSNCMEYSNRDAVIEIARYNPERDTKTARRYCAEQTLVHELLHCKYNFLRYNGDKMEAIYYDTIEHQLLDSMADSLIMAKYNVPFEFFINKKD